MKKKTRRHIIKRKDGSFHQETRGENLVRKALESHGIEFYQEYLITGIPVDFYLPAVQIIIEVDGESHLTTQRQKRDQLVTESLTRLGYQVIRLTGNDVHSPEIIRSLLQKIIKEERAWRKTTQRQELKNWQLKDQLNALYKNDS